MPQHTSNKCEKFISSLPPHTYKHTHLPQPYSLPSPPILCTHLKGMCHFTSSTTVLHTHTHTYTLPPPWLVESHTQILTSSMLSIIMCSASNFYHASLSSCSSHSGQACCLTINRKKKQFLRKEHQEGKSELEKVFPEENAVRMLRAEGIAEVMLKIVEKTAKCRGKTWKPKAGNNS